MNTTLQKITVLEEKVNTMLAVTEVMKNLPSMSEDVNLLANKVNDLVGSTNTNFGNVNEFLQLTVQRLMTLESTLTSLSKVFSALVSELSDSGTVNHEAVLNRIKLADEGQERQRVEYLESAGAIKTATTVNAESLVVVSQVFTSTEGASKTVSDFGAFEMSSSNNGQDVAEQFTGKTVGEIVATEVEGGLLQTKIEKIFDFVQLTKEGETTTADTEPQTEATGV